MMMSIINAHGQGEESTCQIENPIHFLQEKVCFLVHKPGNFSVNIQNRSYPIECKTYRIKLKKNGKSKDSTLYEIFNWNGDGTLSSFTEYNSNGEVWNKKSIDYQKQGEDSIVTITNTLDFKGGHKYFFNKRHLVYKYIFSRDSKFDDYDYKIDYEYDEKDNFKKYTLSYPENSYQSRTKSWFYDSISLTAQIYVNEEIFSNINLNLDSCCVHIINEGETHPFESFHYFDSNGNITNLIEYYHQNKKIITDVTYYKRNFNHIITRVYGIERKEKFDTRIIYDSNGLIIRKELPLSREIIHYHYVFEK